MTAVERRYHRRKRVWQQEAASFTQYPLFWHYCWWLLHNLISHSLLSVFVFRSQPDYYTASWFWKEIENGSDEEIIAAIVNARESVPLWSDNDQYRFITVMRKLYLCPDAVRKEIASRWKRVERFALWLHDFTSMRLNWQNRMYPSSRPNVKNKAWWILHNTFAHILIAIAPIDVFFRFHDYTANKMQVDEWV